MDASSAAGWAAVVVLVGGLLYAAYTDLKTREVTDTLWLVLALVGAVLGLVPLLHPAGGTPLGGYLPVLLWLVVSALVVEHLVPWDERLAKRNENLPGAIELGGYLSVGAAVVYSGVRFGVGATGLPLAVLSVYLAVVFARGLFEVGLLYGGADAKALMVAGVLAPILAAPPLVPPGAARDLLAFYPFAVTLLMNAALLSIAVPITLAVRNLRAGDFSFPRGFTGYRLAVSELSRRFVWIKDPILERDSEEALAVTSEDDQRLRERRQAELTAQGVTAVWVTPQLPFVVLLTAGAILGAVAGNLLFDLLQLL